MDARARGRAGDVDGPMKVGQHSVLERAEAIFAPQKVWRQRRHGNQLAHRRDRLGNLAHQRF
jgi:hypothetical protein